MYRGLLSPRFFLFFIPLRGDVAFISDFNDWFSRVTRPHSSAALDEKPARIACISALEIIEDDAAESPHADSLTPAAHGVATIPLEIARSRLSVAE